jgi:hypothetical protein
VKPVRTLQRLTIVLTISFLLGHSRGEGNGVDTSALEARIDSLLSAGEFTDALASAKELLGVRRTDTRTKPYLIADARRMIETIERIASLDPEAKRESNLNESIACGTAESPTIRSPGVHS